MQAVPAEALPIMIAMEAIHHNNFVLSLPFSTAFPPFSN